MSDDAQPLGGTASEGVLDLDSAMNAIAGLDEPQEDATETTAEAEDETPGDEPDETADDGGEPGTTAEDEDESDEEAEVEDLAPIQAPHSWDKEAKAEFDSLPRAAQEIVTRRENERDRVTSQKLQEAAETRKQADTEAQSLALLRGQTEQVLELASRQFGDRWSNYDWARAAHELDPKSYQIAQADYHRDQQSLAAVQAAQQQAEQAEYQTFLRDEGVKLREMVPELADPVNGKAHASELTKYLGDSGYTAEQIKWAQARDLSLVRKAMLYDRMKDGSQKKAAPVTSKPAAKGVKPTQSTAVTPRKAKTRAAAMARLNQTGSLDDAAAAIMALED